MKRTTDFQTIRFEGGLLPLDLLRRVLDPKAQLDGTSFEMQRIPTPQWLREVDRYKVLSAIAPLACLTDRDYTLCTSMTVFLVVHALFI